MKINFGYHKRGNCWRPRFHFNRYWKNELWWFSFWRLFFVLDFRKNWLADMIPRKINNKNSGRLDG